jgi:hypothetical protein
MRIKLPGMRLRATAAILVIAAGSVAAAAFADHPTVKLEQEPVLIQQDTPWEASFELSRRGRQLDGYRPVIEIEDASGSRSYETTEAEAGVYRAHVVFPRIGPWRYRILLGGETVKTGIAHVFAR